MITVRAIFDENNTASPEEVPSTKFGSNFRGNLDEAYFDFFESEEERIKYYEQLNLK